MSQMQGNALNRQNCSELTFKYVLDSTLIQCNAINTQGNTSIQCNQLTTTQCNVKSYKILYEILYKDPLRLHTATYNTQCTYVQSNLRELSKTQSTKQNTKHKAMKNV